MFIKIAMQTVICRYQNQVFVGMSEFCEKKSFERFIVKKLLRPVPSQGIVKQPPKNAN